MESIETVLARAASAKKRQPTDADVPYVERTEKPRVTIDGVSLASIEATEPKLAKDDEDERPRKLRSLRQTDIRLLTLFFNWTGTESTGLRSNCFEREGISAPRLCACSSASCRCPIALEPLEAAAQRHYGLVDGVKSKDEKDVAYVRSVLRRLRDGWDVLRLSFGPLTHEDPFEGDGDDDAGRKVHAKRQSEAVERALASTDKRRFFAREIAALAAHTAAAIESGARALRRELEMDPVTVAARQSELDIFRQEQEEHLRWVKPAYPNTGAMLVAARVLDRDERIVDAHLREHAHRAAIAAINKARARRSNGDVEWLRVVRDQAKRMLAVAGDAWRNARDEENAARKTDDGESLGSAA